MIKSNAVVKVDKAENWEKAKNYIPDKFTIVVYEFDNSSPKVKLGDGFHNVNDLPFLVNDKRIEGKTLVL